ncbi:MAG TPA: thioesterase family protein [Kofleriaceae bacterium]
MALGAASTPVPAGDGYTYDVPEGWRQGRGTFGGLPISAALRAIEHRVADPTRKVRSVTAELPGPTMAGPAELVVEILRTGSAVTTARAALRQEGEVRAHVVAVLAAARPGAGPLSWRDLHPPEAPPWRSIEAIDLPSDVAPEFAAHFEYRLVDGMPRSGDAARTVGWIRARDPGPERDAGFIAAMIDAWWPAALVKIPTLRPIATIAYTLEILDGVSGLDPLAPLLYRGSVPVCADGYFVETRELWGEDGRLVAINHQTSAIID